MATPAPAYANGNGRKWGAREYIAALALALNLLGGIFAYGKVVADVQSLKDDVRDLRQTVMQMMLQGKK